MFPSSSRSAAALILCLSASFSISLFICVRSGAWEIQFYAPLGCSPLQGEVSPPFHPARLLEKLPALVWRGAYEGPEGETSIPEANARLTCQSNIAAPSFY